MASRIRAPRNGSAGELSDGSVLGPPDTPPIEPSVHVGEHRGTAATLYLNFNGGRLTPGSASDAGQLPCITAGLDFPGLAVDEVYAQAVVDEVSAALAPYAVNVVWRERPPAHVPYTMVMIGADARQVGLQEGTAGYACRVDCFDRDKRDIAFVFDNINATSIARNVLHEAGHTWGLDHIEGVGPVMSPFTSGRRPRWGEGCLPLSDATSSSECGGGASALLRLPRTPGCAGRS